MAEFDDARVAHNAARNEAASKRTELLRAVEEANRLNREGAVLARQAGGDAADPAATRLREIEHLSQAAAAKIETVRGEYDVANAGAALAWTDFAVFTDPTTAVERMTDHTPIALFPLRIETRFKQTGSEGGSQTVLCVMVFPDDVLVDTYQPEISETELRNATIYWTHRWRAGKNRGGHQSAWAALVRSHGAGRAHWLTKQVVPLNLAEEPTALEGDYLLVVLPPAPLPATDKTAIADFWERVWSTSGSERDQAFADLKNAVGESRATEIESTLVPVNLRDVAVKPGPTVNPVVVFLDLPAPSTLPVTKDAWTRAANAWLLPERLVLLGFRDGREVLRKVGAPIPAALQITPDPAAEDDEQIQADGAELVVPEPLQWTVNFDVAVRSGMGFEVNLTELDLLPVFDRLFVLGVRVESDATEGAAELSQLFTHHQSSRKGLSILPQGRATNNTDAASAAFSWWDDPAESFKHFFESDPSDDPLRWDRRKDGAWLAGMLGIDPAVMRESPNYYGTDQAEARAINTALWPATLGYYMEQMMEPVFSQQTVDETRDFFNRFVIGRGTIPLIRIGRQPYGILPATVWSRIRWWEKGVYDGTAKVLGLPASPFLEKLHLLSDRAAGLWRAISTAVAEVGEPGPDPQKTLLDIVGLHPTAAEFYQRYSQSFTQYHNMMAFATEPGSAPLTLAARRYIDAGLLALQSLGWMVEPDGELPELLEKIFLNRANLLKGALVQAELSDTAPLEVHRADLLNYIAWLQLAGRTSHDTLRRQEGFVDGPPTALLYLMLHHALDLGFIDAGLSFQREATQMTDAAFRAERKEPKFIQVADQGGKSRWQSLYQPAPAVTSDPSLRLGDYISRVLFTRQPYLHSQLSALDQLKNASSGALERAFVEHLDCLTYRFDAWRLGMQAVQLSFMRNESGEGFSQPGLYIGAYGWVENVQAKPLTLVSAALDDEQEEIFAAPGAAPLMRDPSNFGHIHALSLDHAVTAAILRNGHLAHATPATPDLLAIDLTSERVRLAEYIIDGIRNGQSLGALLGYRLERALHDEPNLFLDRLIYDLRREFPLVGNRNQKTKVSGVSKITKVEARNVLDGFDFVDHLTRTRAFNYPYALTTLPPLSDFTGPGLPTAAQIGTIIDRHVRDMRIAADAVADLKLAEGVFQVVRGNYDRAAGMLDALSHGDHPPVPEVTATPRNGVSLTHRMSLHLKGGLLPTDPSNPRSKGEPALAEWIAGLIPDPATVFAKVIWRTGTAGAEVSLTPSMDDLGLAPIDLFYMLDAGGARDMPGFDDLLIDFAEQNGGPAPRHDAVFTLEYKPAVAPGLTLFEIAPLVRALRGLVLGARPLRASDVSLQNEASGGEDASIVVRVDKAEAVQTGLQGTVTAVTDFISALDTAIGEGVTPEAARDSARDTVDQWMIDYAAMIRPIMPFGLQAASLTTAVEGRRARFTAILDAVSAMVTRWEAKRDDFNAVMAEYAARFATATDEEKTALLVRAGRIGSTTVIAPLPPTIADLETAIATLRTTFDAQLANLITIRDGATTVGALLIALTVFEPTIEAIDQSPFDLAPFRDSVLALAEELRQKAIQLRDDINLRITEADAALTRAAAALGDKAQAAVSDAIHALLGDAFIVLPEFTLSAERLGEWNNVWNTRSSLLTHLTTGPGATPFPLDDWLHGLARVRERCRHIESATMLSETLGTAGVLVLEALQFPHRPDNAWLGLRLPETLPGGAPFILNEDKLLYSAYFGTGAEIVTSDTTTKYSGLLLDEWVEVVPTDQITTGVAFHFDRPNSEAPQTILLVTPPVHDGVWQWQDLVDTLHETLDFARLRAVEPAQLDQTIFSPLLPAVISAVTMLPLTAMLNFAFNNNVQATLQETRE